MYSNILVALDGSEPSSHALDTALTLASETGARLHPVYVVDFPIPPYGAPDYDPTILLDSLREEGLRVAESVLRGATCPVLMIPARAASIRCRACRFVNTALRLTG